MRVALFQFEFTKDNLSLPEPDGDVATMQERVLVPAKEYPDVRNDLCNINRYWLFCSTTLSVVSWAHGA